LVGLAVALAAPAPKEATKKEASIVGEWVGEKFVMSGKEVPAAKGVKGLRFTFTEDGKVTVQNDKSDPETGTYKIDGTKDRAEIDLLMDVEKNRAATLGLYKVDGDTLTLCFEFTLGDKAERPTKIESPAGSSIMLMTFKRAKK
jgi:uncharacterized protein (TIGR03067 family)